MTATPAQKAVIFYDDGDTTVFMNFQRIYLNNALSRFMINKNLLPTFEQFLDEDEDFEDEDVCYNYNMEEEPYVITKPEALELIAKFLSWGLPDPRKDVSHSFINNHLIYLEFCYRRLRHYPSVCGEAIRDKVGDAWIAKDKSPSPCIDAIYDRESGVLIHPRYSGSILIKGQLDDQPIVFGYCTSRKYDLPCCFQECIFPCKPNLWGDDTIDQYASLYKPFQCESGVVVQGDLIERSNLKRKSPPGDLTVKPGDYEWIQTQEQLETYLGHTLTYLFLEALEN